MYWTPATEILKDISIILGEGDNQNVERLQQTMRLKPIIELIR
jgi:hypothetical protein